ncbi:hypothetical protein DFJ74DRAFT_682137 [Hyaloraphidium curvatum]|nr:hypothetical protein DFJ74DRAFT_682137 [Hyaloraphidium curvatum]
MGNPLGHQVQRHRQRVAFHLEQELPLSVEQRARPVPQSVPGVAAEVGVRHQAAPDGVQQGGGRVAAREGGGHVRGGGFADEAENLRVPGCRGGDQGGSGGGVDDRGLGVDLVPTQRRDASRAFDPRRHGDAGLVGHLDPRQPPPAHEIAHRLGEHDHRRGALQHHLPLPGGLAARRRLAAQNGGVDRPVEHARDVPREELRAAAAVGVVARAGGRREVDVEEGGARCGGEERADPQW